MSPVQLLPTSYPPKVGYHALQALLRRDGILGALESFHRDMGDIFRLPLPRFSPIFLVGPEANHFVLATGREDFRWRTEGDPVTRLLRQGLLVTDGNFHDDLRRQINPALHKRVLSDYVETVIRLTDEESARWAGPKKLDMLVEMRRLALRILMEALFRVDIHPDLKRLFPSIIKIIAYISPGAWILLPGFPRPGYARHIQEIDAYLLQLISSRRKNPCPEPDLLDQLLFRTQMNDGLVRDQLLTLLIAGHDTSTALLSWALFLLGSHPKALQRARAEVDACLAGDRPSFDRLGELCYIDQVIKESLRLYPPIHLGMRRAAIDLEFQGYRIPAGSRVAYSIYLSHRQERFWPGPGRFEPERFSPENNRLRPPYVYVPFGGGPRNCIGMAFAQVEAKAILARLLQKFDFNLLSPCVRPHMGATLEPRPGVFMSVTPREGL